MSNFKFKNKKKTIYDSRVTLDVKHNENIDKIKQNNNNIISNFDKQINEFRNEIKNLENDNSFLKFEKIHDYEQEIKKLEKQKFEASSNKNMNKYFLKSGKIMFDYYENKKTKKTNNSKVNRFFNIQNDNDDSDDEIDDKKKLINKYMEINDETYQNYKFNANLKKHYECPECKADLKIICNEAMLFCEDCGYIRKTIIDMIKPSYKDPPKEAAYFNYKRINHFNEWLAQFQAKETTEIPTEVYSNILVELKKQRSKNIANLKSKQLRNVLKKLRLNKYYEHIPHIINKLNGIPAPRMTRTTEEKLRNMFKEIQIPFIKHCPSTRKNFMSYSYVLHKFCQLLELDEFLECFPLLKSSEKLYEMDKIWKKICEDLRWEFIKSV